MFSLKITSLRKLSFTGYLILLLFMTTPFTGFAQKKDHAFLIACGFPNAKKIAQLDGFKGEKLNFDNLDNIVKIDIDSIKSCLKRSGFTDKQITVFQDTTQTIKSITDTIKNKTRDLEPNSLVLLYFTGHGIQKINKGTNADLEKDGLDECLVLKNEVWVDDDINDFYSKNLSKFQNVMILDACFSGTTFRLESARSTRELLIEKSNKDYAEDSYVQINAIPGCTTMYSDPSIKTYSLVYFGASGDSQQAKADINGSWLTQNLAAVVNLPTYGPHYSYRLLYCSLRQRSTAKLGFRPTYVEIGNNTSQYATKQPLTP